MTTYLYTGEHHTVTIENIRFVKGEPTSLTEADEKNLLASGFGKAMIAKGELICLDEQASGDLSDDNPTDKPKKPKKTKANEPQNDGETQQAMGEP